jgi:hypothetical protein
MICFLGVNGHFGSNHYACKFSGGSTIDSTFVQALLVLLAFMGLVRVRITLVLFVLSQDFSPSCVHSEPE